MADFGWALSALKGGQQVSREGWNGKGMWLTYVQDWTGNFGTDLPLDWSVLPFIAMKTVQNQMVPWLASQTDVLALDWGAVYVN